MEGRTAEVFDRGDGTVVKVFRPGYSKQAVEREAHNAAVVAGCHGVPAPRLIARTEQDGRAALVYERVNGASQLSAIARNPLSLLHHATVAAELHARIHGARPRGLPDQRETVAEAIGRAPDLDRATARAMIERAQSWPQGDALCHGDFHPENILLSPGGPVVIDWMNATVGLAEADVARTAVILRFSSLPPVLRWRQTQYLTVAPQDLLGDLDEPRGPRGHDAAAGGRAPGRGRVSAGKAAPPGLCAGGRGAVTFI